MTDKIKHLIENNTYLIDYVGRNYTYLNHSMSTEELYEVLCTDYELYQPYTLDIQDFEDWVNYNHTAMDILQDDAIKLEDLQKRYDEEVVDGEVEEFFTDSENFAWL